MQSAPTSPLSLRRFARSELRDGRSSIDVITDLEARGMPPREAETLVEALTEPPCAGCSLDTDLCACTHTGEP